MADDPVAPQPTSDRLCRAKQRVVPGLVGIGAAIGSWFFGTAVLPRWWAQRMGYIIDGQLTFGIVVGDGNAAHVDDGIHDVDGPDFRGGTLVGTVVGLSSVVLFAVFSSSRSRNKRKAKNLKSELDARDRPGG